MKGRTSSYAATSFWIYNPSQSAWTLNYCPNLPHLVEVTPVGTCSNIQPKHLEYRKDKEHHRYHMGAPRAPQIRGKPRGKLGNASGPRCGAIGRDDPTNDISVASDLPREAFDRASYLVDLTVQIKHLRTR